MDLGGRNSESGGFSDLIPPPFGRRGVRALVLVGGRPEIERFGEFPLAQFDVLGRSVLMRTLDRIRAAGVDEIAVLSDTEPLPPGPEAVSCKFSAAKPECFWNEALQLFRSLSWQSECVLVFRLGAWAEVDLTAMVSEQRRAGAAIMRAHSRHGEALDVFAIASSSQSEAATLLRGELRYERVSVAVHKSYGYVNLLRTPADLRRLTLDAFAGDCEIRPCGSELRPGVWVGSGARIHRGARVLAPSYIGCFCKVRRAAIITRGSSLEHHAEVDCATVIDNSSVMAYTRVGAGLDVERSLVGLNQVHSLQRNITVVIEDPHLIGTTTTHFSAPLLSAASWLFSFMPSVLRKLLSEPRTEPVLRDAPGTIVPSTPALSDPSLAPVESQTDPYREMAETRRYGNE